MVPSEHSLKFLLTLSAKAGSYLPKCLCLFLAASTSCKTSECLPVLLAKSMIQNLLDKQFFALQHGLQHLSTGPGLCPAFECVDCSRSCSWWEFRGTTEVIARAFDLLPGNHPAFAGTQLWFRPTLA